MNFDCVVVGAGLAGMTAGVRLAEAGARVAVIAKGVGSLHLGGATIDVLGYSPGLVESPAGAIADLVGARPDHPYARVGSTRIGESVAWLKDHLGDLDYRGDLNGNYVLPTAVGAPKPSAVVPRSLVDGDLRRGGKFVVVGFASLKDFYPAYCADNLNRTRLPGDASVTARGITIDPTVGGEADVSALGFARHMEDPEFRKSVIASLESGLGSDEVVGFPATLGLDDSVTVWRELCDGLNTEVFEIPTLPPSVPGMRAFRRLRSLLRSAGGRLLVGPAAVGAQTNGSKVTALEVDTSTRVVSYSAREFVVATGGVVSGGIEMDSDWTFREPVLGLPIANEPGRGEERWSAEYFGRHAAARAGVAVDAALRPVDARGDVLYENVRVVGASIGGAEPWREKSGNGLSLATGYAAADEIIRAGKGGS